MRNHIWGGPQLQAEPLHQLPLLTPIWKVMPKWTVTSACPLRLGSCCLMQPWTLPARGQGFHPKEVGICGLGGPQF